MKNNFAYASLNFYKDTLVSFAIMDNKEHIFYAELLDCPKLMPEGCQDDELNKLSEKLESDIMAPMRHTEIKTSDRNKKTTKVFGDTKEVHKALNLWLCRRNPFVLVVPDKATQVFVSTTMLERFHTPEVIVGYPTSGNNTLQQEIANLLEYYRIQTKSAKITTLVEVHALEFIHKNLKKKD